MMVPDIAASIFCNKPGELHDRGSCILTNYDTEKNVKNLLSVLCSCSEEDAIGLNCCFTILPSTYYIKKYRIYYLSHLESIILVVDFEKQ